MSKGIILKPESKVQVVKAKKTSVDIIISILGIYSTEDPTDKVN